MICHVYYPGTHFWATGGLRMMYSLVGISRIFRRFTFPGHWCTHSKTVSSIWQQFHASIHVFDVNITNRISSSWGASNHVTSCHLFATNSTADIELDVVRRDNDSWHTTRNDLMLIPFELMESHLPRVQRNYKGLARGKTLFIQPKSVSTSFAGVDRHTWRISLDTSYHG